MQSTLLSLNVPAIVVNTMDPTHRVIPHRNLLFPSAAPFYKCIYDLGVAI